MKPRSSACSPWWCAASDTQTASGRSHRESLRAPSPVQVVGGPARRCGVVFWLPERARAPLRGVHRVQIWSCLRSGDRVRVLRVRAGCRCRPVSRALWEDPTRARPSRSRSTRVVAVTNITSPSCETAVNPKVHVVIRWRDVKVTLIDAQELIGANAGAVRRHAVLRPLN